MYGPAANVKTKGHTPYALQDGPKQKHCMSQTLTPYFCTGWNVLIGPRQKGHKGLVKPLAHIWYAHCRHICSQQPNTQWTATMLSYLELLLYTGLS